MEAVEASRQRPEPSRLSGDSVSVDEALGELEEAQLPLRVRPLSLPSSGGELEMLEERKASDRARPAPAAAHGRRRAARGPQVDPETERCDADDADASGSWSVGSSAVAGESWGLEGVQVVEEMLEARRRCRRQQ